MIPKLIEPLVPVDLVVDHSVQIDYYNAPNALDLNMKVEFRRNAERYKFIKWGMQAFNTFKVVPPGIGIVHQVNLEYLARGVHQKDGVYYPDTLVGTDSHTTMINGIGVVGWGVGGIEAEAGMLGQPVYLLTPDVVGVHLHGKLGEGVTATDLVLTITEMLRNAKVVGSFVEFFGAGTASLTVPDRATIANMAPEYGATMGFFPVDDATVNYFGITGRTAAEIDAFVSYYKAQDMFGIPEAGTVRLQQGAGTRSCPHHAQRGGTETSTGSRGATFAQAQVHRAFQPNPSRRTALAKPAGELPKRYPTRLAIVDASGAPTPLSGGGDQAQRNLATGQRQECRRNGRQSSDAECRPSVTRERPRA